MQARTGTLLNQRTLVVLEEGARAEVWEQYLSGEAELDGVFNAVTELIVGDGAHLRYVCGQGLSERSWIFGAQRAEVGRDAGLDWVALGFGSARGRVRMETRLGGEGAEARVTGAYASHARQHIDFDTTQEHAAPNTTSDLAFRGVLTGRSSAVWRGNIIVDPGAQKTDAFQESRNLLLSKRAHADAIPGLEIQANDVRCTHAAAVAQLDPEQLFYLRSRGLKLEVARRLVIEGFLAALVERFEEGPVRERLADTLERRLGLILAESLTGRPGRQEAAAISSSASSSSSSSSSSAASRFSSKCAIELVPGIGTMTGECWSSQASATCAGVAPWPRGDVGERGAGLGELAHREREIGQERESRLLAEAQHILGRSVDDVVLVLNRDDRERSAGPARSPPPRRWTGRCGGSFPPPGAPPGQPTESSIGTFGSTVCSW